MMERIVPCKPTPQYLQALVGESKVMIEEYYDVVTGKRKMSPEDRQEWNDRREWLSAEIKRVRGLL